LLTAELHQAILTAAGLADADPLLRPGSAPGRYASSLPFRLAGPGQDPRAVAAELAARLASEPWIAAAEVTGAGYLTVTVSHDALAGLAVRIARAGPASAASDLLHGRTVPAPPQPDLAAQPGWPQARAALAAHLTARLAAAAGATLIFYPERAVVPPPAPEPFPAAPARSGTVAAAVAYAGADAVRFALAWMPPGGPAPQPGVVARHVLSNPAYAVRYAHAAAAAVLRWAAALGTRPAGPQEFRPRLLAAPGELALLDALSWLPERVAMAARRGRPDEFAGYLEGLASRTIDTMSTTGFRNVSDISSERLWLAAAARAGLAAGLGLLGVSAPERL
jgi:arginyl-tRNA synthetase